MNTVSEIVNLEQVRAELAELRAAGEVIRVSAEQVAEAEAAGLVLDLSTGQVLQVATG